jgi:hypothetical protein
MEETGSVQTITDRDPGGPKLTGPTDPEPDITFCWRQAACRRGEETRPPSSRGEDPPAPSQYRPPCGRPGSGGRRGSPPARTAARQECRTPGPCRSNVFHHLKSGPLEGCNAALATRKPMRSTKLASCCADNANFEYRLCSLDAGTCTWYPHRDSNENFWHARYKDRYQYFACYLETLLHAKASYLT